MLSPDVAGRIGRSSKPIRRELSRYALRSVGRGDPWFLRKTDMGRVFAGIDPVEHDPGAVDYWFKTPGRPPWLCRAPDGVEYVHYRYGKRK